MKYFLSEKITNELLKNNSLSLELAGYMNLSQQTVLKYAKEKHEKLVAAAQIEFFKGKGWSYEEIVDKEENKK